MFTDFFVNNLDIAFLFCGLAFFTTGIAVLIYPCKNSEFKLSNIIWLLGIFGIIHAINDWLYMIIIIRGCDLTIWTHIRSFVLIASYAFLFEFGRRLILLSYKKYFNMSITIIISIIVIILEFVFYKTPIAWPRYFLGFPGGLMTCIGFLLYFYKNKMSINQYTSSFYFIIASVSMLFYGMLGGIIVPETDLFPASIISNEAFFKLFHIPVQIFRAVCATILAWCVLNILKIFNLEYLYRLNKSLEEVVHTKNYIENVINSAIDTLIVVDPDLKVRSVNKAACELLGYKEKELIGKNARILFAENTPYNDDKLKQVLEDGFVNNYESIYLTKNKEKIPVLFSESVFKNGEGEILGIVGVGKDIREIKRLQEDLARSEKLASLGKFASILGHEFRNQLGVMNSTIYFLKLKLKNKNPTTKKYFTLLEGQITETSLIINDILSFARVGQIEKKEMNLLDILRQSIVKLNKPKNITVMEDFETDISHIRGDSVKLVQVFYNIALNSIEAMKDNGGSLTVSAKRKSDQIQVSFKDTGCGIKKENENNIFEPFFSTKEHGTGLGLVIAKIAVEMHSGTIEIRSKAGKGTTVNITIPAIIKNKKSTVNS